MNAFEGLMVFAAGLFAGGALTFAWSRVPIWRRMPLPQFVDDFAQTLSRTDKVQPALLVAGAASAAAFAVMSDGTAALLAAAGASGLALALVGSLAVLVPLQRRLIAIGPGDRGTVEEMRARWFRGNLGRSIVATLSFALIAVAGAVRAQLRAAPSKQEGPSLQPRLRPAPGGGPAATTTRRGTRPVDRAASL